MTKEVFLLADIGGTNARFALAEASSGAEIAAEIYKVREHPTLVGALRQFCNSYALETKIIAAAFGVAGPVLEDVVHFTNSDWVCDKDEISKIICTQKIFILNDFEAIALAVGNLDPSEVSLLQTGRPSSRHPMLVMGPGTGLGVAALVQLGNGNVKALTTEAGHTRYAPANEHERKIIRLLTRTFNLVSAEHLISGPGLVNLYRANSLMVDGQAARLTSEEIVMRAREGNELCRQVLDDFAAVFGSFASQLALSWNALGGVYLAGGVMQKIGDLFDAQRFLERFNTNPRMAHMLSSMPVMRVHTEVPAYSGLLTLLKSYQQKGWTL